MPGEVIAGKCRPPGLTSNTRSCLVTRRARDAFGFASPEVRGACRFLVEGASGAQENEKGGQKNLDIEKHEQLHRP